MEDFMKNEKQYSGYLYIGLCTLIFSTMEVMLKIPAISGVFAPMQITMERFLVGGICLLPLALSHLKKKGLRLTAADLRYFALTGLLCVPLSMVFYQLAITYGHANTVAVLFSGNPVFVTFLAFLLLREAIHWNNYLALVLEILGILAIINPFSPNSKISLLSVTLAIISALLFSLYSVLGKRSAKKFGGLVVPTFSFLFGGGELLLLLLLGHTQPGAGFYHAMGLPMFCNVPFLHGIQGATIPYFLFICLINNAAGYVFHMLSMEKTDANTANLIFFFKPIIAPIFALVILHEAITVNIIQGIALFLCGSLMGIIPNMLRIRRAAAITAAGGPLSSDPTK